MEELKIKKVKYKTQELREVKGTQLVLKYINKRNQKWRNR